MAVLEQNRNGDSGMNAIEKNRKLDEESARLRAEIKNLWGDPWEEALAERRKERENEKAKP